MSKETKKIISKLDDVKCVICGDRCDGHHYNVLACRSCTAFFRRTVSFKKRYICNGEDICDIGYQNRNTCKSCRYKKCINSGMEPSAVQPKREPTGAQPNRRNRRERTSNVNDTYPFEQISLQSITCNSSSSEIFNDNYDNSRYNETLDNLTISSFAGSLSGSDRDSLTLLFKEYVHRYREINESLRYIYNIDPDNVMNFSGSIPLRKFHPKDSELLAQTDLVGVTAWISKIEKYGVLCENEKASILQRFALRKIMLDHYYTASKYKSLIDKGIIVLPNYTFITSEMTGFEKEDDDGYKIATLNSLFRKTLDYSVEKVIKPISELNLMDEEIVTLYLLLLWNATNEKYVDKYKREIFSSERDWTIKCLFIHYNDIGIENPEVRFGEIIMLLKEFEWCSILHFQDYYSCKSFNIKYLKNKWYDTICYSPINFSF